MLDFSTDFGKHVARRLREEHIIWLTTVGSDGTPQPNPVGFVWNGDSFLIYSRPDARKLDHIAHNPNVSLNLDGDGRGSDIVVFTGKAALAPEAPPAHQVTEYVEKYREEFQKTPMTLEQFAAAFSVAIRIKPLKLRGAIRPRPNSMIEPGATE